MAEWQATPPVSPPWNPSIYTEPPSTPVFSAVKTASPEKDVTYCVVDGVALKLDISYPSAPPTEKFPVVVAFHGGGWSGGYKEFVQNPQSPVDGAAFVARGYALASVQYRLAPKYKLPTMVEDAKCAIRYLRARAASYNIDPNRIGAIGPSAGGYIVAMLGIADSRAGFEGKGGFDGVSSRVQAVVSLSPAVTFELPSYSAAETVARESALPTNASPELLRALSVSSHVSRNVPPFLFFHGEFDAQLSPGRTLELHAEIAAAGGDSTYILVRRTGHGWLPDTPGLPMPNQLPNTPYGPEPTVQEITRQQLQFFDKYLKHAAQPVAGADR